MSTSEPSRNEKFVVLFDGECVLCNGWARFVAERDPAKRFALGALQSEPGTRLLQRAGIAADVSSIVLIRGETGWRKSDAVLRILAQLPAPWPLFTAFRVIPRPIRDAVYDIIARNRYRWFGKTAESCPMPTPELRARLLEAGSEV